MNSSLIWRGALIFALAGLALWAALPLEDSIHLGLDLRGGTRLVMAVHTEDALKAEAENDGDRLVRELADKDIDGVTFTVTGPNTFLVKGVSEANQKALNDVVGTYLRDWDTTRSSEGVQFARRTNAIDRIKDQAVRQAQVTIRNRVDQFGVAEPVIQRQGLGGNRIEVQLPGVDDPERVKALIKSTALLEFRLVDFPESGGPAPDRDTILSHYGGTLPDDVEIFEQELKNAEGEVVGTGYWALEKKRVITGRDLKDARPSRGKFQEPVVSFSLNADAAKVFGEVTGDNVGRGLAIVLDGKVQSAPKINGRITDSGIIEGMSGQQEVEDLSLTLRSGALPAEISYLEERTVGPSLGQDSINQGLRAGLLGGVLVVLAMLVVYKGSGINAVVALAFNVVLIFGALAYFGATLTLPGIAGLILTIGMAVDANVLVFERIREELHQGRTVKASIAAGFEKALSSVMDANITTLIAAMFLFNFGTGPIRGFAVTLSIGILASLFTAIFNSRWLFDLWLARPGRGAKLSI